MSSVDTYVRVQSTSFASVTYHFAAKIGQINFKLYDDIVPKTAANFRSLCTGDKGLSYKNSIFYELVEQGLIEGGDITRNNGTGGESIYGSHFPDENFKVSHDRPGLLSMLNGGPNTKNSRFAIYLVAAKFLDGKNVVFGEIADEDSLALVRTLSTLNTVAPPINDLNFDFKPKIVDCGAN